MCTRQRSPCAACSPALPPIHAACSPPQLPVRQPAQLMRRTLPTPNTTCPHASTAHTQHASCLPTLTLTHPHPTCVVLRAHRQARRARLLVPPPQLRKVRAIGVRHGGQEVVARDCAAVVALKVQVHACSGRPNLGYGMWCPVTLCGRTVLRHLWHSNLSQGRAMGVHVWACMSKLYDPPCPPPHAAAQGRQHPSPTPSKHPPTAPPPTLPPATPSNHLPTATTTHLS